MVYILTTPLAYQPAGPPGNLKTFPGPYPHHISRASVTIYLLHKLDPASAPMAHIADCLLDTDQDDLPLGLNNYIAKALSPQDSNESVCNHFNFPAP